MENYIQQSEGARLIKLAHLSIWHLMLINIYKTFLFTKYCSPIVNFWPNLQIFELVGKTCHGHTL